MAKSMARLCIAAWLIVALPVILCVIEETPSEGPGRFLSASKFSMPNIKRWTRRHSGRGTEELNNEPNPPNFGLLSKLDGPLKDSDCAENRIKNHLAHSLERLIGSKDQKTYAKVEDYFGIYLDKCGFEGRLLKVKRRFKIKVGRGKSLANYLLEHVKESGHNIAEKILFALEALEELADPNYAISKYDCKDTPHTFYIGDLKCRAEQMGYIELKKCLDHILADHLKACAPGFKVEANRLIVENKKSWEFIKKFVKLLETKITPQSEDNIWSFRSKVREILPAFIEELSDKKLLGTDDANESKDVLGSLRDKCRVLWSQLKPTMYNMAYDFAPITEDEEVVDFIKYLSYCALATPATYSRDNSMFDVFGVPFCRRAQPN